MEEFSKLIKGSFGKKLVFFKMIDSTNTYAKLHDLPEGGVVFAEEQTAGRGRFQRKWHSEPGKNLTFSVKLRPGIPPENFGIFSLYAALAVARAVECFTGIVPTCKWPNDLLLAGGKFSGILCENLTGEIVAGIGVNVNQTRFPENIGATSLALHSGKSFERFGLMAEILWQMESLYPTLKQGDHRTILDGWLSYSSMIGRVVTVLSGETVLKGKAAGLAEDGGLMLEAGGGIQKVNAGEVTVIS